MKKSNHTISVIFPVHNESEILSKQITSFIAKTKSLRFIRLEIILVERGSRIFRKNY